MKRINGQRLLYHACRLLLGGIFLYAGMLKAHDVTAFAGSVASYQILPYAWNFLVAAILPYVEIIAGILLLLDKRVRPAALLLGVLTLVFVVVLVSVLVRGLEIDCGCFNPAAHTTPLAALGRDVGILLLVVVVYCLRGRVAGNLSPK
jgi:uncharacterized membrane protein YphA (DoxX/SURF4 family)